MRIEQQHFRTWEANPKSSRRVQRRNVSICPVPLRRVLVCTKIICWELIHMQKKRLSDSPAARVALTHAETRLSASPWFSLPPKSAWTAGAFHQSSNCCRCSEQRNRAKLGALPAGSLEWNMEPHGPDLVESPTQQVFFGGIRP